MAGFLYYIPGRIALVNEHSLPEDLRGILDGATLHSGHTPNGPDGGPGMLFGARERLGVNKSTQTWVEVKGSYWIGFDNADKPRPDDLMRPKLVSGTPVELGDGNQWIIPSVHFYGNTLPKAYRVVDGQLKLVPIAGFEEISQDADYWFEVLMKLHRGESVSFKPWDLFRFFVGLLKINYRLGEVEAGSGIDIITNDERQMVRVITAAFGFTDIAAEEEQKKTADTL